MFLVAIVNVVRTVNRKVGLERIKIATIFEGCS
jgi:hypothetical protein